MVEQSSGSQPAGWHPDPHSSGMLRYWDGTSWTEELRPNVQTPFNQGPSAAADSYQSQTYSAPRVKTEAGFFRSIFDLSFAPERVVVITFARLIYLIAAICSVSAWIVIAIILFVSGEIGVIFGVLQLLFGWIFAVINIIIVRVALELSISQVRTSQNTARLVRLAEASRTTP